MCNRRLSGSRLSVSLAPNSVIWKIFSYTVANVNFPSNTTQLNHQLPRVTNNSSFSSFTIFNSTNTSQALLSTVDVSTISDSCGCLKSKYSSAPFEKPTLSREIAYDYCAENLSNDDDKEMQRRKKIGLANKGRVPWNKGKKHDMETRKRIKQRTIEALRDPKVRKKMSEHPRMHSDQVKVKIRYSLRHVWGERLKKKRSAEKFVLSWMEHISFAAKKGGKEQDELNWDSYDKIKQEMRIMEKAKVKEMRAEIAAKRKAEKAKVKEMRAEIAAKRKAEKAKVKEMRAEIAAKRKAAKSVCRKEKEDGGVKAKKVRLHSRRRTAMERLRLRQRLKKIRRKISITGAIVSQGSAASAMSENTSWEKLDLELIKKGHTMKETSLADQIQVAKNRKAESIACRLLASSTFT